MTRFAIFVLVSYLVSCSQAKGQGGTITTVAGNQKAGFSGDGGPATSASLNGPAGIAVDSFGNLFISDTENHRIRKISASGTITTVAGNGRAGFAGDGGPATSASLNYPWGVAVDAAGNLFIADNDNNRIRRVSAAGIITTFAGNGPSCSPTCGSLLGDGGLATAASLNQPLGVAVDASGNLFIADNANGRIRKVSANGIITVVAGGGGNGLGDGGLATEADLGGAWGVAVDASGNLFIADGGGRIRKVSTNGIITTVAGSQNGGSGGDGGPATFAGLEFPGAVASDAYGNLFIADSGNDRIRRVSPNGVITTIAGGGVLSAYLADPLGVAVDASGNLFIVDGDNSLIRKVSGLTPSITALPANINLSLINGGSSTQQITLTSPGAGLAWSASTSASWITLTPTSGTTPGAITVTVNTTSLQPGNYTASITISNPLAWPSQEVQTVNLTVNPAAASISAAPTVLNFQLQQNAPVQSQSIQIEGTSGIAWRATVVTTAERAWLGLSPEAGQIPASLTATVNSVGLTAGTYQGSITVEALAAVPSSSTISVTLEVTAGSGQNGIITTVAGNGTAGFSGDGGPAPSAELYLPGGVAVDASGNLFIADTVNSVIRKLLAATAIITTVAGNQAQAFSGEDGPATSASLNRPSAIALDASGDLFIADTSNSLIRKVSAASGVITTVAGVAGTGSFGGDGGPATSAFLNSPQGVTVDASGNLFIADTSNNEIRKVSASGIITRIAGSRNAGFSGDGGTAKSAGLNSPRSVAVDAVGNIFIADTNNQRIRKVATSGIITTVAGGGNPSVGIGDGGPATSASFQQPVGVTVDAYGNLFIADSGSFLDGNGAGIRKVSAGGTITTIAGGGYSGFSGDGGPATSASLNVPEGIAVDAAGNLFIADTGNNVIREVLASASTTSPGYTCTNTTPPVITSIDSASGYGGYPYFASGSWLEIKGTNLADPADPRLAATNPGQWTTSDFNGSNAPTSLDGISVTINRKSAYVWYLSPMQLNVQAPEDSTIGNVAITVTNCKATSSPFMFTRQALAPGLLAPSNYSADGTPYMLATFQSDGAYVLNTATGAAFGLNSRPAKPGDLVIAYGIGFGDVIPSILPGVIVGQSNALVNPVTISFGSTPATLSYSGLAGGFVGLYEFFITVPSDLANGDYQINAAQNGTPLPQNMYLTVHN